MEIFKVTFYTDLIWLDTVDHFPMDLLFLNDEVLHVADFGESFLDIIETHMHLMNLDFVILVKMVAFGNLSVVMSDWLILWTIFTLLVI